MLSIVRPFLILLAYSLYIQIASLLSASRSFYTKYACIRVKYCTTMSMKQSINQLLSLVENDNLRQSAKTLVHVCYQIEGSDRYQFQYTYRLSIQQLLSILRFNWFISIKLKVWVRFPMNQFCMDTTCDRLLHQDINAITVGASEIESGRKNCATQQR